MPASPAASGFASSPTSRHRLILIVYTAAIFTSALLLFSVQPMFTRLVLPRLGGSPAVWSVAMVFFQTLLLAGYAYAHYLMKLQNRMAPVVIHLFVLLAAVAMLPLAIASGWGNPPTSGQAFWLLGLFTVSIGLPFFALAANNPLLQAWFVRTGHPDGPDPYFLYASSNIGSFLALLSYPVLLEPMFLLRTQNLMWTGGYVVLIVLIAACGFLLFKAPKDQDALFKTDAEPAPAPSWSLRLRWIFLAAVPSGLLVAVTSHISTDVAAAPLLWVLPLSLYLLTWVLVFQQKPLLPHKSIMAVQPLAIAVIVILLSVPQSRSLVVILAGHLLTFFLIAMACHGELARTRPAADHLTGFYVSLSFGGMVGGLFSGLIAPYVFNWIAEYPILLVMAALCRPDNASPDQQRLDKYFWPAAALLAAALAAQSVFNLISVPWLVNNVGYVVALVALLGVVFMGDRLKLAFMLALAVVLIRIYPTDEGRTETVRSFYGVHKIVETSDGLYHYLLHGTTIHGAQKWRDPQTFTVLTGRPEPISYYHSVGGIGQAIEAIRARKGTPMRVAAIGLGSGTLTCHSQPGENWRFFEIDQSIVDIARDPKKFTFVSNCMPDLQPVMGDARLTFQQEPDGVYDLIIVDAYSSDAIPIHLATREAMAIYKQKLAPQGAVLVHVSNRHLELASVIVGIANANALKAWVFDEDTGRDNDYIFSTEVVLAAREEADIGTLAGKDTWTLTEPDEDQRVWTDDYSNILGAVWRRLYPPAE